MATIIRSINENAFPENGSEEKRGQREIKKEADHGRMIHKWTLIIENTVRSCG
jgi:hypothetical protein